MTQATIPIPYALGAELWWVGNEYQEQWVTCAECAGSKAITVIFGNGETASLACAACLRGYEPPAGVVKRVFYEHKPTPFTANRVRIDGDEVQYSTSEPSASCYRTVDAKALFLTEAECQVECDKLNAERIKHEEKMAIQNLASKRRDLAWSAHYWRSEVARLEKNLESARARLAVCKERKKTD